MAVKVSGASLLQVVTGLLMRKLGTISTALASSGLHAATATMGDRLKLAAMSIPKAID